MVYMGHEINEAIQPITDIAQYPEIIKSMEPDSLLIAHFPQNIPSHARKENYTIHQGFCKVGQFYN
jgi:hypothetical protein